MDTAHFHKHGYQVFENIIGDEILERIRLVLETDANESIKRACAELGCNNSGNLVEIIDSISREKGVLLDKLSKSTRDTLSGHISLSTRLSEDLRLIPQIHKVKEVIKSALKSENIFMHMPPTARFVLPQNVHAGVPPHQDISYNKHMTNFVVLWVPLVDIDDFCGGVQVYKGSGQEPEHAVLQGEGRFWQDGVPTKNFEPIHCKIKKGGALLLNKWVIHSSMPNFSNITRYSIDHRFFGDKDRSTKHYLDIQNSVVVDPN